MVYFNIPGLKAVPIYAWIGAFGRFRVQNICPTLSNFDVTCQAACIWICETEKPPTLEDFIAGAFLFNFFYAKAGKKGRKST